VTSFVRGLGGISLLALFFSSGPAFAVANLGLASSWLRAVKIQNPLGPKELHVFSIFNNTIRIRRCQQEDLPRDLDKYNDAANVDMVCAASELRPDITASLSAFKAAMSVTFMVPKAPHLAVPRPLTYALTMGKIPKTEAAERKDADRNVKRLASIKNVIDTLGKPSAAAAPVVAKSMQQMLEEMASGAAPSDDTEQGEVVLQSLLSDSWMFSLVNQFDKSRGECGPISEPAYRYQKSCAGQFGARVKTPAGVYWHLHARKWAKNGRFYEVWYNETTHLYWSNRLDSFYRFFEAADTDGNGKITREIACGSEEGKVAGATTGMKWRLPSIREYKVGLMDGLLQIGPVDSFYYWAAGLKGFSDIAALIGKKAEDSVHGTEAFASVRCVSGE
jgi:hypothetical protein